ncbi:hypothetical protein [Gimesia maris]|jgi:uncharacterized protein YpmS|uniref:Uncharacterized protein n=1 Tax=Gimesia maris TaxID=122 RepID=A0A3D3REA7_9PLAN|nr:hypothetical protein [Gimesia maris]MAC53611.1 hypothetical protein [Gimesia sp.]EDL59486.1 hypothetical protein PM8797T_04005 [Gimesia maris DSM 8797]QDU13230.1 hypothetical protein CA11_10120 [Gimesia maris]QEG15162.1 hypothetical protein GmarT_10000 [Gimesia maris]QGQ31493.1 hypothetical protein F1729_24265 [Gimesia maris]|tara:strand:- start:15241 stop:15906 length:666 start_codon:yes stop_codon:yes gene_type:complete
MKRYLLFFFLVLLFLTGIAAGLYWSSAQVPDFYQEALQEQMEPEVRQEEAKEFVQRSMQVVNKVRNHEPLWSQEFSEQQVNAWLAEELHQKYNKWVPDGVTDPRIRFEKNQVELGFHLSLSQWSGIISLKFKPWLMKENRLVLELEQARAGLLPIPIDEAITELIQEARKEGWFIEWGQSNGNDAIIVYLDRRKPELPELTALAVETGLFRIAGKSESDTQ